MINAHSVSLLRWGALAGGLYWGYSHHASLLNLVKERSVSVQISSREALIAEAKLAYEAQLARQLDAEAEKAGVVTTDSNSYRYNAEKYNQWSTSLLEQK